jgi:AcrR family transcriptional regulator
MPKVIANPRENILAAARLMLTEDGYKAFSMREAA